MTSNVLFIFSGSYQTKTLLPRLAHLHGCLHFSRLIDIMRGKKINTDRKKLIDMSINTDIIPSNQWPESSSLIEALISVCAVHARLYLSIIVMNTGSRQNLLSATDKWETNALEVQQMWALTVHEQFHGSSHQHPLPINEQAHEQTH